MMFFIEGLEKFTYMILCLVISNNGFFNKTEIYMCLKAHLQPAQVKAHINFPKSLKLWLSWVHSSNYKQAEHFYSHIIDCGLSLFKGVRKKNPRTLQTLRGIINQLPQWKAAGGIARPHKGKALSWKERLSRLSLSHWFWETSCTSSTSRRGERNKVWRPPLNSTVTNPLQIQYCSWKYVCPSLIWKAF